MTLAVLARPAKLGAVTPLATPGESMVRSSTDAVFAAKTYTKLSRGEVKKVLQDGSALPRTLGHPLPVVDGSNTEIKRSRPGQLGIFLQGKI